MAKGEGFKCRRRYILDEASVAGRSGCCPLNPFPSLDGSLEHHCTSKNPFARLSDRGQEGGEWRKRRQSKRMPKSR